MTPDDVRRRFETSAEIYRALARDLAGKVHEVGMALAACLRAGGTIYLFGNGGSAADSQHIAAELVGRYLADRPALPAVALTTDTSKLTAIANDYGYEEVFARQLAAFVRPADAAIGISTSGRSKNVVKALALARERGALTVALTGADPADCAAHARFVLAVPSKETPRIQESHIAIGHALCEIVELDLAPRGAGLAGD
ncbi:MAG: D-sedoheptulose 7-phosphate isomerase [Planctomycetes bacterium]|nr:D-sedoheptulose 7-phosphate isomerase [Planctomycetota bacterium]